jgi:hypothetical protein
MKEIIGINQEIEWRKEYDVTKMIEFIDELSE